MNGRRLVPQAKRGPHMSGEQTIRIAQSCAQDPRKAVEELHAGLAQPDATLVIFFCSSEYDREVLAAEMAVGSPASKSWAARRQARSGRPGAATTASRA